MELREDNHRGWTLGRGPPPPRRPERRPADLRGHSFRRARRSGGRGGVRQHAVSKTRSRLRKSRGSRLGRVDSGRKWVARRDPPGGPGLRAGADFQPRRSSTIRPAVVTGSGPGRVFPGAGFTAGRFLRTSDPRAEARQKRKPGAGLPQAIREHRRWFRGDIDGPGSPTLPARVFPRAATAHETARGAGTKPGKPFALARGWGRGEDPAGPSPSPFAHARPLRHGRSQGEIAAPAAVLAIFSDAQRPAGRKRERLGRDCGGDLNWINSRVGPGHEY